MGTAEFSQIDEDSAQKQATDEMAFTRRTLKLFNDVNIYSISPVFVFDVARIGPRNGTFGARVTVRAQAFASSWPPPPISHSATHGM